MLHAAVLGSSNGELGFVILHSNACENENLFFVSGKCKHDLLLQQYY